MAGWILPRLHSLLGWTFSEILTSSSYSAEQMTPGLVHLLENISMKAGQRRTARVSEAQIYSILNSELREDINESCREVCRHYNVQLIELHDIEKQNGHPSINGMKSICEQLLEAIDD